MTEKRSMEISNLRSTKRYPVNIPMTFEVKSMLQRSEVSKQAEAQPDLWAKALIVDISEMAFPGHHFSLDPGNRNGKYLLPAQ